MILFYRIFFPFVFIFFLPGLLWKLVRRSGYKKTYMERFSIFAKERREELKKWKGAVWIHAVSVGETNIALTTLKKWLAVNPSRKFILSTTTTTGQEIARNLRHENVRVIFCPIDFSICVNRTLKLLKPSALVIFETELWPNLILSAKKNGAKLLLINARISDKSSKGYIRFRRFFAPMLMAFDNILAQTELDKERLLKIAPELGKSIRVTGNIKFDQEPPKGSGFDFSPVFGGGKHLVLLGASTHPPEEKLILDAFLNIKNKYSDARLVLVPRHAERGGEVEKWIQESGLSYVRRSVTMESAKPVKCLLADTTGELASIIKSADIVIMGKTLAGNDEGQSIIEPALMGKAIISGPKLKNFRQALEALVKNDGVFRISKDDELTDAMDKLSASQKLREQLGRNAENALSGNKGALNKTIEILEDIL